MAEVLDRLLEEGVDGRRIAIQLHGEPLPGFVEALRAAGAEVLGVPVYRWMPPEDIGAGRPSAGRDGLPGAGRGHLHQRPAAASLLSRAEERGLLDEVLAALSHDVLPACVGPVTALPLQARGIDTIQPERFRLGPLVQLLCQELPRRARSFPVAGHRVEIRGHAVLVDGELQTRPAGRDVPAAGAVPPPRLGRRPRGAAAGAARRRPRRARGGDGMARLRTALGTPKLIQTVVKRGYRLALDPSAETKYADA